VKRKSPYLGGECDLERNGWSYIKMSPWQTDFCPTNESISNYLVFREHIQAPVGKRKKLLQIERDERFAGIFETTADATAFGIMFTS
jgi:hypothetical protein